MAWTKNSKKFYILAVQESDDEVSSKRSMRNGFDVADSGWTLRDLQNFWMSYRIDFAINNDGGIVAQMLNVRPDGRYDFLPPRWSQGHYRREIDADFGNAPKGGGTLMSWYVIEKNAAPK